MLLDTLLAAICKAANCGTPFISLDAHWLYPKTADVRFCGIRTAPTVHINAYLV